MLIVACIKWGKKYPAEYVNKLANSVARNMKQPHNFVCYTDDPTGVECACEPLPQGYSGWWNKLFLFSIGEAVLLIDLDCVIIGGLDALTGGEFKTIKDPWQKGYNSSVVMIPPDMGYVWERFKRERPDTKLHGDQDWLNLVPGFKPESCFADPLCQSYKAHVQKFGHPAEYCRVVYFHGIPKPHQVNENFVRECWK